MKRIVFTTLWVAYTCLTAQETQIIHHMNWVPQSLRSNPAQLPDYKFYIGLPVVSSVFLGVDHGISFNDVMQRMNGDTILIDPGYMLKNLRKDNFIGVSTDIDILSFGFRIKRAFLHASVAQRNRIRFNMPSSLLEFVWKGNGAFLGETVDMSSLALEALGYGEIAVGLSMPIGSRWIVAGRFKYLSGLGHAHLKASSLEVTTDPETYAIRFKSGMDIYTAGPDVRYDEEFSIAINAENFQFKNPGMAFDLAATFLPHEKWRISGGISDMGYIKWQADARRHYVTDGEYSFAGLDIKDIFNADTLDFNQQTKKILDTLKVIFDVQNEDVNYTRALRPQVFLSGEYQITPRNRVGALVRAEYFSDRLYPTVSLAYHHRLGRVLSLSGSYTIRNRSYYDIGGGMALKLGPVQFYLLGDNLFSIFWPEDMRSYSVHLGLNMVFGRTTPRKEKKAKEPKEEPEPLLQP